MYGNSKDDGNVIGLVSGAEETDQTIAQDSARVEEALLGFMQDATGDTVRVCWKAALMPSSGDIEWETHIGDDYIRQVHQRTMAMSLMTSMLRDNKRNNVYEAAVKIMINNFRTKCGSSPMVLDIGSGTSLLSLLCASNDTSVIGCEMFDAMAEAGQLVVQRNGLEDRIRIVPCKSTELDQLFSLARKPDLLVSELLDSALLGESCVFSHAHAIANIINHGSVSSSNMLENGSEAAVGEDAYSGDESLSFDPLSLPISDRVIPHNAHIRAALIESEMVHNMIAADKIGFFDTNIYRDEVFAPSCSADRPLIPIHWDIYHSKGGRVLSDSVDLLNVDFFRGLPQQAEDAPSSSSSLYEDVQEHDHNTTLIPVQRDGIVHGVLLYWDLFLLSPALDPLRCYHYCTKPPSRSLDGEDKDTDADEYSWQDHWVQCVYPLPQPLSCVAGDLLQIDITRDFINISLSVTKLNSNRNTNSNDISEEIKESAVKKIRVEDGDGDGDDTASNNKAERDEAEADEDEDEDGALFASAGCTCGWHLLCGAERLEMLNDPYRKAIYQRSLERAAAMLLQRSRDSSDNNNKMVVTDVGDGSLLSLALAKKIFSMTSEEETGIRFISIERKDYSRLLHAQLVDSNQLGCVFEVCDGEGEQQIVDIAAQLFDDSDTELAVCEDGIVISMLLSECFQYQMSSLPTWQAISFWYKRSSEAIASKLSQNAIISPYKAFVKAAAVYLPDLSLNHGLLHSVKGFDHSAYDEKIANWHEHMYPYKLGNYRKSLLSQPVTIATIDYSSVAANIAATRYEVPLLTTAAPTEERERGGKGGIGIIDGDKDSSSNNNGTVCHGVVIWVDYQLLPTETGKDEEEEDCTLQHYYEGDFPVYYSCNIKFFPDPIDISQQSSAGAAKKLICESSFDYGNSDFSFNFAIE